MARVCPPVPAALPRTAMGSFPDVSRGAVEPVSDSEGSSFQMPTAPVASAVARVRPSALTAAALTVSGPSDGNRPVSHLWTPKRQIRATRSFATETRVRWPGTKARPRMASVCP